MPLPIEPGQVLAGKYQVERVLGEGGMGVVLLAQDLRLERHVAIKFLLPELARQKEASARFLREARAAVKIQSEHIARVIDVDTMADETPYMVMEYLEGKDLERTIAERGALAVSEVCSWVIQACEAIAEAHSQRIVHRDLKPANLFLARQSGAEIVKVLDFGISKQAAQAGPSPSLTRTSAMLGSPLYMSPEQMRSTRDVDTRTDIWALGTILHEALSGKPPFEGESIPQLSAQILLDEPARLDTLRSEVPKALADIVWRALRKDPADRFANVGELALALLPFAHRRAHTNFERIQRVLSASGLLTQPLVFSDPPAPAPSESAGQNVRITGHEATVPPSAPAPAALAAQVNTAPRSLPPKGRTLANFGQTSDNPERRPSRARWAFAALGVLLVGGAGAAFFKGAPPTAHTTPVGPAAVATMSPEPNKAAAAAEPAALPANIAEPPPQSVAADVVGAAPNAEAAPNVAESSAAASASSASSESAAAATGAVAAAVTKSPAAAASVKAAAKPARPRPTAARLGSVNASSTTTTTTSTRHTTSESSTYSGTFKSKFGSRK
jgi:serine/threonine protein kinase